MLQKLDEHLGPVHAPQVGQRRVVLPHEKHPAAEPGMLPDKLIQTLQQRLTYRLGRLQMGGGAQKPCHHGEGRIQILFAAVKLHVVKAAVILGGGGLDGVVLRHVGLDDHLAGMLGAARPARHLGEQLEGALGGPVIGHVQRAVGQDSPHQGDLGKIQALGDHLGAHQHLPLPGAEGGQQPHVGVFIAGGVHIHAQDAHAGITPFDLLLHPLSAHAAGADISAAAMGTGIRHGAATYTRILMSR